MSKLAVLHDLLVKVKMHISDDGAQGHWGRWRRCGTVPTTT